MAAWFFRRKEDTRAILTNFFTSDREYVVYRFHYLKGVWETILAVFKSISDVPLYFWTGYQLRDYKWRFDVPLLRTDKMAAVLLITPWISFFKFYFTGNQQELVFPLHCMPFCFFLSFFAALATSHALFLWWVVCLPKNVQKPFFFQPHLIKSMTNPEKLIICI